MWSMDVPQRSWEQRLIWSGMVSRRGIARLIDDVLLVAIQFMSLLAGSVVYVLAAGDGGDAPTDAVIVAVAIASAGLVASIMYEVVATWVGASLGKLVCGLRVIDADSGRRLSLGRSIRRWLLVSGVQPLGWLALGLSEGTAPRTAVVLACLVAAALAWRTALAVSVITSPGAHQGLDDQLARSRIVRRRCPRSVDPDIGKVTDR